MLEASIRSIAHIQEGLTYQTELMTAPAKVYKEWFSDIKKEASETPSLQPIQYWEPPKELYEITTIDQLMDTLDSEELSITHPLTDKGIQRFAQDWKPLLV